MRLFLCVELPAATRQALRALQQTLEATLRAHSLQTIVRWSPAESMHLTLRFLGETGPDQRRVLERSLATLAAQAEPTRLEVSGLGVFPSYRRPSVLWSGVDGTPAGLQRLHALQRCTEDAARAAGFAAEERAWSPHLTLARFKREASPATLAAAGALLRSAAIDTVQALERHPLPVDSVLLMRSDLRPAGAIYTPLAHYRLGGTD
jgi:2'-5' RNA ligase